MNRPALIAIVLWFSACAIAAEDRSSFESLPTQTVLAVRMPEPAAVMQKLTETTRLGNVMFGDNRLTRLMEVLKNHSGEEWEEFASDLAKVGLTPEELPKYLQGDMGYALVMVDRQIKLTDEHDAPMLVGLLWLTPGAEQAAKLVEAIAKAVELDNDENQTKFKIRRTDIELAGQKVMQFAKPVIETDVDDEEFGVGMDGQPKDAPAPAQLNEEHVDQSNLFVAQIGGRVLIAHTFDQSEDVYHQLNEEGKKIDYDQLSGSEQAAGVLARFIAAHGDEGASYSAYLSQTPGLTRAMPQGQSILEVYGDMRTFWKLAEVSIDQDDEDDKKAFEFIKALGVTDINVAAMKLTLLGNSMRAGIFLSAPAPRKVIGTLFEQPVLQPAPPAWVPADVTEYSHLSFDLGKAYELIRQVVIEKFGDDAKMAFDQADMTLQNMTQSDLKTVLSGLGKVHSSVRFISRFDPNVEEQNPGDQTRMAVIWKLENEPAWTRMIQALAPFTMQFGDQLKAADEQGFTGWRLNLPQMQASIMIGKGHMALSLGNEVTEQVLTVLRNPPAAADSLGSADWYKRATQAFEFQPGFAFTVTDSARMIDAMIPMLKGLVQGMIQKETGHDEEAKALWEEIMEIMPDAQAFKGTLDVSGSQGRTTDDGMVIESFTILPAP